MASLVRAAEHSFLALQSPLATEARLQEIDSVNNPAKRVGLAAIHKFVELQPNLAAAVLGFDSPPEMPEGFQYLSRGHHSIVFLRDDNTVLKVNELSAELSPGERREVAQRLEEEHEKYRSYLGGAVLPHTVIVAPHPLYPDRETIQIEQPYRSINYLKLNEGQKGIPRLETTLKDTERCYPGFLNEVDALVVSSRDLYRDHALSTDIIGINNFGTDALTSHLITPDGQPITTEFPAVQKQIGVFFDNLEVALGRAAA